MSMIEFISFDDVRAALGVSYEEIDNATLSLDLYEFNLIAELDSIDPDLISTYVGQTSSGDRSSWSLVQTRFYQSVRLFAAYAVAKQATIALPMFGPKEQTDGKASLVRFSQDPYKLTIASVLQKYEGFRAKLEAAFNALSTVSAQTGVVRTFLVISSPDYDPVIGG